MLQKIATNRPHQKIIFVFVICQVVLALLALLNDMIINTLGGGGIDEFKSFQEKIMLVLFVAPVFETLVFNLFLNEVFFRYIKNVYVCIVLSSLLFGLIHYYSFTYVLTTFLAGLVLNWFYFWVRHKKDMLIATLCVLLLHFNHNLMGILLGK